MSAPKLSATSIGELVLAATKLNEAGVLDEKDFERIKDAIFAIGTDTVTQLNSVLEFPNLQEALEAQSPVAAAFIVRSMENPSRHAQQLCAILLENMYKGYPRHGQTGQALADQVGCSHQTVRRDFEQIRKLEDNIGLKLENTTARGFFFERITSKQ